MGENIQKVCPTTLTVCPITSTVITRTDFILETIYSIQITVCFLVGDTSFTVIPFGTPVSTSLFILTFVLHADCVDFPLSPILQVGMTSENEPKPDYEI